MGIVFALLFMVLTYGLLAGAVYFAFEQNRQYLDIRDRLGAIEAQARRVNALEARWRGVADEAESIEKAFVRRDQLSDFLEAVEATAANAGVAEVTSIFEDTQNEIRLRLRVSGPFEGVYTFVTHLNVLPNLLFLERVDFSRGASVFSGDTPSEVVAAYSSAEVIIRVPLKIVN